MTNPLNQTACFTGGRPNSLYPINAYGIEHKSDYRTMIENITEFVIKLYEIHHIRNYISGGAQGFDQLAFWAIANLKKRHHDVQNIIYIPFKGQDRRWQSRGFFSQTDYSLILKKADAIYNCNPSLVIEKASDFEIADALLIRNRMMINHSGVVIGQYPDDSWKSKQINSGTTYSLRFANQQQKRMFVKDFRKRD